MQKHLKIRLCFQLSAGKCSNIFSAVFQCRYPWCSKLLNGWWEYLGKAGRNWSIKACFLLTLLGPFVYFAVNGLAPFFLDDFYKLVLGKIRGVRTQGETLIFFIQSLLHSRSLNFPQLRRSAKANIRVCPISSIHKQLCISPASGNGKGPVCRWWPQGYAVPGMERRSLKIMVSGQGREEKGPYIGVSA